MRVRLAALAGAVRGVSSPLLIVSGFVFLTAAAWMLAVPAGLAAAGVSCLVVEFLLDDPQEGGIG